MGVLRHHLVEHSLQDILDESLSRTADRIKLQSIHVNKTYPDSEVIIQADKEKLSIAFTNIIINAIEAMEANGTLSITVRESVNTCDVFIKDTGKGIPKESVSKLFEPFFTMKKGGMGLGLTVAYSIFQSHHAMIKAYSKEHEGSEFQINFRKSDQ